MNINNTVMPVVSWLIPGLVLFTGASCLAQTPYLPAQDILPNKPLPNMEQPSMMTPMEDIIQTPEPESQPTRRVTPNTSDIPAEILVKQFIIEGNSVFSSAELEAITATVIDKPISLSELLQVSSQITDLYNQAGYITSGAYISADETFEDGIVTINIVEGDLEAVNIAGLKGLNPGYVRSRLKIKPDEPLNVKDLISNLKLLQLDPQVNSLSAELQSGNKLGSSVLNLGVEPADSFNAFAKFDNARSPSVGTFRRGFQLQETSLLGFGDPLNLGYFNSEGSDEITLDYTLPLNARNSTIGFNFSNSWNNVSEEPFNELDIQSNYQSFGFTFRQPIIRSLQQDLALGLTFDRQRSKVSVLGEDFALSTGADEDGETRITALRFFQEWSKRNQKQVFGLRSQFNVGLGLFNASNHDDENIPDGQFFSWQGQAQWARQLGSDSLNYRKKSGRVRQLTQKHRFSVGCGIFISRNNLKRLRSNTEEKAIFLPRIASIIQIGEGFTVI